MQLYKIELKSRFYGSKPLFWPSVSIDCRLILKRIKMWFFLKCKVFSQNCAKTLHLNNSKVYTARVKVLLNCSAGIKIAVQGSKPRNLTKNYINSTQIQGREFRNRWINIRTYSQIIDDSIKCGIMIISGVTRM